MNSDIVINVMFRGTGCEVPCRLIARAYPHMTAPHDDTEENRFHRGDLFIDEHEKLFMIVKMLEMNDMKITIDHSFWEAWFLESTHVEHLSHEYIMRCSFVTGV